MNNKRIKSIVYQNDSDTEVEFKNNLPAFKGISSNEETKEITNKGDIVFCF